MVCRIPGFLVLSPLLEVAQTHVPWVNDTIQPSDPLSSPSSPVLNLFQHQGLFQWFCSSHQVAKVQELQLQDQSFQWMFRVDFLYDWLVWSPCGPSDAQESTPAPQFESINSVFSLLYGSILTSVHDYWKNHILTIWTFVSKVKSLLFNMLSRFVIAFLPRSKHLNFMAAVTVHSDFGAQENKTCHSFHFFSIYLPWSDGIGCHDLSFLNVEF